MNKPLLPRDLRLAVDAAEPLSPAQLTSLREHLPVAGMPDKFARAVTIDMPKDIVMQGADIDFDTNWQYARLLHNMGRTRDALHYATVASDLQPDNFKAAARLIEILLDLNKDMPHQRYEETAFYLAQKLDIKEQSEYSADLVSRAQKAFYDPEAAFNATTLRLG